MSEQCLVQPLCSSEGGGRGGDHPHEVSDEVNTAARPRPLSLTHRVNCGQTVGLCYLSLPPDRSPEAEPETAIAHQPRPRCEYPPAPFPPPAPHPAGEEQSVSLGWVELGRASASFNWRTNRSRPAGAGGEARPRGNEVPADGCVTG